MRVGQFNPGAGKLRPFDYGLPERGIQDLLLMARSRTFKVTDH